MEIPSTKDLIQETKGNLGVPEIRVWCHPERIGKTGDDYYNVFETFKEALSFIKNYKEAEEVPLIAFRGYEINLWEIQKVVPKK